MPTRDRTRDDLLDALLSTARALVAVAARSLADLDIEVTLPQFRALTVLAYRGPQRGSDIATELAVNPSTGTRMVDRLVRKGLVRRHRGRSDRRAVLVAITAAGRAVVDQATVRRREMIAGILAALPEQVQHMVADGLRAFAEAAGEIPDSQWPAGVADETP